MISDQNKNQQSGDSSTNLQGESITINQGLSYSDAKQIAIDVFKANALELAHGAGEIAKARAEEISDAFFKQLERNDAPAVAELANPGMQAALYEAQKQFAKSGDKDLEGLLVDILVARASTPERNTRQIVLDDSLVVASKLTAAQMDALTVNFIFTQTKRQGLENLELFKQYLRSHILPFVIGLTDNRTCYSHLEYTGCISALGVGSLKQLETLVGQSYPGLFSKGFEIDYFKSMVGESANYQHVLVDCLHFVNLKQIGSMDEEALKLKCAHASYPEEIVNKMVSLLNSSRMPDAGIKSYIVREVPELNQLFDFWKNSPLSKFTLTSVGISIALANYHRRTGIKLDLETWVND